MEQRATWTDERLDDLAEAMRTGFSRLDQDIRELRGEMQEGRAELRAEMQEGRAELRAEMQEGRAELRGEIQSLRSQMFAFQGATIIALIGVIGAILARGA